MKNRAVIYARYSTDMQSTSSIVAQVNECKKYIIANGWTVAGIYSDEAVSGQKILRAGIAQIIDDAKLNKFDYVVVHSLSRASRMEDLYIYYQFKHSLKMYNVELRSSSEDITNDDVGEVIEFLAVWQAKKEIQNIRKNVMRNLVLNAEHTQFNGGIPPLGYDIDNDKHYVINASEAETVRTIFKLFLDGSGYSQIATRLNLLGYKTKKGSSFGKNSIREILRNKKYIGTYEWNRAPRRVSGSRNNHSKKTTQEIIVKENAIPNIISNEVFKMAENKITTKKHLANATTAKRTYILSGLLKCGVCDSSFSGRYNNTRDAYYYECIGRKNKINSCNNKIIRCEKVDNAVLKYLQSLADENVIDDVVKWFKIKLFRACNRQPTDLELLQKQREKLKAEANALVDKLVEFDSPSVRSKILSLDDAIEEIDREITNILSIYELSQKTESSCIRVEMPELKNIFDYSPEKQKNLCRKYIDKVILTNVGKDTQIEIKSRIASIFCEQDLTQKMDSCNTIDGAEGGT